MEDIVERLATTARCGCLFEVLEGKYGLVATDTAAQIGRGVPR